LPSAHAHLPDEGTDDAPGEPPLDRPILLVDIDQILEDSAGVERAGRGAPIRVWRDELTLALESLTYAREVLASDVEILRHCLATPGSDAKTVVDELPKVMTSSRPEESGSSSHREAEDHPGPDPGVFVRSDQLMSAHLEMARVDLSSPEDVSRVLGKLEEQLAGLTERHDAVGVRLHEIRAAIVRQYQEGAVPTRDWPG
jgi:hypothetical protein